MRPGEALGALRSSLGLALALLMWVPGLPTFYLLVLPLSWLRPGRRAVLITAFMRGICFGILGLLRLGGARFERRGAIPTHRPVLVVMNHQSLIDILTVTLTSAPYTPAFVTRKRYARFIPLVSPCIRLLGCPIIDPKNDPRGAAEAMRRSARELEHGLLVFPEGHRTRDGSVQPFRTAGLKAVLEERRLPVYLMVGDGFWSCRRFVDFLFHLRGLRGETEVLGPFEPPADAEQLPEFIRELRERLVERLEQLREKRRAAA